MMRKRIFNLIIVIILPFVAMTQIELEDWKFKTGDDMSWATVDFNDSDWATIKGTTVYEKSRL